MAISASQLLGLVEIRGAAESIAKLEGVGRATDSAGAKLAGLAVGGVVLAGAALVGLGVAAVKMDADLQQGVNRLRTGAGDATDSFSSLRTGIQQAAVATGVMTGPLTQAMYLIISSGQRGAQAMDTLTVAAKGAQIEQANVVDVANVVSGAMHNFGTSVFSAADYMNGLMKAVSLGKISLQDLSTSMGPLEPLAHQLGISYNDLSAAMTTQTNAMIPAARAATSLRFMMQSLEVPTKKAKDEMAAMGLNSVTVGEEMKKSLPGALQMIYDAAKRAGPEGSVPFNRAFSDMIGGQRSLSAALALTGTHMKDFVGNSKAIADAMDTGKGTVNGWAIAQSNLNVQLDKGRAMLQVLGQNVGEVLMPYVSQLLANVTPLIGRFQDWFVASGREATVITAIGTGMSTLGNVVGTTAGVMGNIIGAFTNAGTEGEVLRGALVALAGAFVLIKAAAIPNTILGLLDWVNHMTSAAVASASLKTAAASSFGEMSGLIVGSIGKNISALSNMGLAMLGVGGPITLLIAAGAGLVFALTHWQQTTVATGNAFNTLGKQFQQLATDWNAQLSKAQGSTQGFGDQVKKIFWDVFHMVEPTINETATSVIAGTDTMKTKAVLNFTTMYQGATDQTTRLRSGVTLAANTMSSGLVETVTYMQAQTSGKFKLLHDDGSYSSRNLKDQMTTNFFNMHKQVYSETSGLTSQALQLFKNLNGDLTDQMNSIDQNVIGYWNDIAAYIAGNPIQGSVNINVGGQGYKSSSSPTMQHNAAGTSYAPGGWSWVGEQGPELAYIPRGTQIVPHNQSVSAASSSSQPVQLNINIAGHNVARVLLPELVTAIRGATGAKF